MAAVLKDAFTKRMSGDKPSSLQAVLAATVAGAAVAVVTYRLLRS
ncbi:MAG: hypothetical protein ACXVFT_23100 [Solirubrobacteraceae bacterium]